MNTPQSAALLAQRQMLATLRVAAHSGSMPIPGDRWLAVEALDSAISALASPAPTDGGVLLAEVSAELDALDCGPCIGSMAPWEDLHGRIKAYLAAQVDDTCTEPNRAACPRMCMDFCNKAEEHAEALAATPAAGTSMKIDNGNENAVMLELAEFIARSAHPEDERLTVADAIARYLKLDWPSAEQTSAAGGDATDEDIQEWLERHDLEHAIRGTDARAAFEDAQTFRIEQSRVQDSGAVAWAVVNPTGSIFDLSDRRSVAEETALRRNIQYPPSEGISQAVAVRPLIYGDATPHSPCTQEPSAQGEVTDSMVDDYCCAVDDESGG